MSADLLSLLRGTISSVIDRLLVNTGDAALEHTGDDAALEHTADDATLEHTGHDAALEHTGHDAALEHTGDDAVLHTGADVPVNMTASEENKTMARSASKHQIPRAADKGDAVYLKILRDIPTGSLLHLSESFAGDMPMNGARGPKPPIPPPPPGYGFEEPTGPPRPLPPGPAPPARGTAGYWASAPSAHGNAAAGLRVPLQQRPPAIPVTAGDYVYHHRAVTRTETHFHENPHIIEERLRIVPVSFLPRGSESKLRTRADSRFHPYGSTPARYIMATRKNGTVPVLERRAITRSETFLLENPALIEEALSDKEMPPMDLFGVRTRRQMNYPYIERKCTQPTATDWNSLLKKHLTPEVFNKLKEKKTSMGATLMDVIQSGVENLDSGIGIYAPDAESYTVFADLFNPVIEEYHAGFGSKDSHPQKDFGDTKELVDLDPEGKFVVLTRVRCGRSLKGYPFNPCLTEAQYKEIEQKVSKVLGSLTGDLKGTYYPLKGMDKATQQKLIDDHFLFKEGDRFLQAANSNRFWPTGRGIFFNDSKTFLVWVNEEDHLRIISMQMGGDLKQVYERMVAGVNAIEAKLPFARDDRLGYLTFCPTNLGTTIRASVHIKVPKLAKDKSRLEKIAKDHNLQVRGTSGEHSESEGGVYDISNKRRLGLTEFQAVKEMQDGIVKMIGLEQTAERYS